MVPVDELDAVERARACDARRGRHRAGCWPRCCVATVFVIPIFVVARPRLGRRSSRSGCSSARSSLTQFGTTLAAVALAEPEARGIEVWARVGVIEVGIAVVIYATGWGATLALGSRVRSGREHPTGRVAGGAAAGVVHASCRSPSARSLVAVGAVPSLLPQPQGHGLAVLEAVGAAMIIALLGWATAGKERVEETVRRSEERFRALVQHGSDVIMVIDLDGAVRYVSPSIGRALGYDADAITRLTADFIDEADLDRARAFLRGGRRRRRRAPRPGWRSASATRTGRSGGSRWA